MTNNDELNRKRQDKKIQLSRIFDAGYGIVPKLLLQAMDITGTTKLLLCYLLTFTGGGRFCFPSQEKIGNDLSISGRTVRRCIEEARSAGYLAKTRKFVGRGYGSHNEYDLLFMADSPIRQDTGVRSKDFRQDKNDTLDRPPEHHKNKQLKYKRGRAEKRELYPQLERIK